ncbi:hypothetical protein M885DRAFT_509694 [Pelagophyceae sp. CCMP2097]|nr:hypothetical protein M885DRAFT_509694 [Pelagophyceae sp. CCMP2097]|mmetsp:Transcript_29832/g.100467  ORF Transcript_29832/g.100467 Transcript_29832/m.100467 type:complete len:152 (+) Transcript_29832:66-521(+)|eukprot:CAMPEP_0184123546 /NCGR_PEP_ID=MMETSP0974-20121125/24055_1 /TAXON_ID=483370 /ORGANISM="non described non described, Strain CCMP2097" /LENGTH=151 /DNA_ID=CAMNT_0026426811 /DNA_START=62 /DNA_END=517 /DNA_ORIENTATION=-
MFPRAVAYLARVARAPTVRRFSAVQTANVLPDIIVTKATAERIAALSAKNASAMRLRLAVDSGGCSGFSYVFSTELCTTALQEDDVVFLRDEMPFVVDESSLAYVKGATIDYESDMMGSAFAVTNNPLSESACGCGSSFAVKNFEDNPALD